MQATVQVAAKDAEESLPGGEELAEGLRSLFFERAEETNVPKQEKREKTRKKRENRTKELVQTMAATEVRRANQLIFDGIAALGTFTGDSNAWSDWQKNSRRVTREFDNDLKNRVFRLICGGLAKRRLDSSRHESCSLWRQCLSRCSLHGL